MTLEQFVSQLHDSGVISAEEIVAFQESQSPPPESAEDLGKLLVKHKKVTKLQAQLVYQGKGDRLLLGNYVIQKKIGAGGMGDVYLAKHKRMKRKVALKTLPAAMTQDQSAIRRFEREVEAAAKLSHTNIVTAFDADEANGVHYFVMEYVDGIDLSAVVKKQGVLKVDVAVDYILQAARGLEYAHEEGIIHRDIKPANLLLDKKGTIKILDMGLARIEDEAHDIPATQLTQDGSVMGTIDYMAPEQAKDTHTADARSDIYSLGCSFYYLLTGESVYSGSTMVNRIMAHQNDAIPSLSGKHVHIPADVDAVYQKMIAKKPEDRFQSMQEVIDAINRCDLMKSSSTVSEEPSDPELHKFLQSRRMASSPTVVMSADAMTAEKPLTGTQNETLTSGFLNHTLGGTVFKPLQKQVQSLGKRGWIAVGTVLASLILLAGIILKVDTAAGTIILEIDQPELAGAVVSVDEQKKITIKTGEGKEPIEVVADEKTHTLQVTKGGFETFTKQFTVKAGGKETVKVRLMPLKVATKKKPSAGTPAKSHYALRFQNSSDYVTLPLKHETAGDLTVEAWVTIDEDSNQPQNYITNAQFFIGLHKGDGKEPQWFTSITNDGKYQVLRSNSKPELGKRTNIAITFKGNVAQIYVNGHKDGEMNIKGLNIHRDRFITIGCRGIRYFKGSIDEVRFSNIARYTNDFTPKNHFETDKNTLALYHFDEGTGEVLKDSSGNGHDGKIIGAKWVKVDDKLQGSMVPLAVAKNKVPSAGTPAKSHSALRFQNDSDRVILPLKHETAGDLTVEAWVTIDENSNRPLRFIANGSSLTSFGIGYSKAEGKEKEWSTSVSNNGQFQVLQTDSKVEFGKRTNIAVTYKGNVAQIYVNGHKKGEMNFNGSNIHTDEFITIGNRYKGPPIKGSTDEVRFSNIARYTEDFTPTDHFENDKNTLALYHFDEAQGDILKDSSGNGHDGKIVGAKWIKVDDGLQVTEPSTASEISMTDREVAEWVIGMGGWVNTGGKSITKIEQLPTEPFVINFLDLKGTSVKDDDLKRLAGLKTLPKLNLENTLISDTGLQYLKDIPLNYISLIGTQITDKWFGYLSNMPSLTTLYVGSTAISNFGVEQLKDMKQLEKLSFTNTQIDGVGLGHLKDLKNLKILGLESTSISDVDLQHLHGLKILIVLGLSNCKIADSGLAYLKDLKNLKVLSLDSTPITDVGLKHLSGLKMLQTLELQKTKVTPQGIADLQKALPNCKIESDFGTKPPASETENYGLQFNGESSFVEIKSLTGEKYLQEKIDQFTIEYWMSPDLPNSSNPVSYCVASFPFTVSLNGNNINTAITAGDSKNTIAYGSGSHSPLSEGRSYHIALVLSDGMQVIYINGKKQADLLYKTHNGTTTSTTEKISLSTDKYRSKQPTGIGAGNDLSAKLNYKHFFKGILDEVRISNTARYTKDFTPDKRFNNDKNTLALYHFDEGGGDVLKDSSGNGHDGKIVGAKWVKVDDELDVIKSPKEPISTSSNPNLTAAEWVLSIGGHVDVITNGKKVTAHRLEDLPKEPFFVYSIYLNDNKKVTDDRFRLLKDLKRLEGLYLKRTSITSTDLQHLVELTNLTQLDISFTSVGDDGLQYLPKLEKLTYLNLEYTKITDTGVKHLTNLRRLRNLHLSGTQSGDEGLEQIKNLIKITQLHGGKLTTDDGLKHLGQMKQLLYLGLNNTLVTGSGLVHLPNPEKLVQVSLMYSAVTDSSLQHVSKLTNLRQLDLNGRKITDAGLKSLESLKQLKTLILYGTETTDTGLKHLESMQRLESLDLRDTKVTAAGIKALNKKLPQCKITYGTNEKPLVIEPTALR